MEQRIDQPEWWGKYGWEALRPYLDWCKNHSFDDTKPMFWDNDKQNRLAKAIHFPTDKGWMPAWRCYAGKSWDGPESFDEFFKKISDRGILSPLEDWEKLFRHEDRNIIKGKLRYAGVSWEPKVLKFEAKTEQDEISFEGNPKYPPNCWKDLILDNYWERYCKSLFPKEFYGRKEFERDAKLKKQWAIEYFPYALPPKALDRIKIIGHLAENIMRNMRNMTFTCTRGGNYNDRVDNSNNSSFHVSFAYWQLTKIEWLPCKTSLIYKNRWISPSDGYLPGKGLGGLLPEIDIALEDNQEGRDIKTFLTRTLGVREDLPPLHDGKWEEWFKKLPEHVLDYKDKEKAKTIVKTLWKKIFEATDITSCSWLRSIDKIPCIVWQEENEILEFRPKSEVYWVDEGYLNERSTRNALLKNGYSVFILELQKGERINELFKVGRLSEKIAVEHYFEGKNEDLSTSAKERYQERYKALKAIQNNIKLPNPDSLLIDVVKNLKLKVSGKDGKEIAKDISRPFWIKEDKSFLIDEDHRWEGFGLALADSSAQRGISSLFENILKTESWDEVLRRLREAGVPENSVHELEQFIIPDTSKTDTAAEENRSKPPLPEQATEPSSPNYPKKDGMPTRSASIEDEKHPKQFKEEDETSKTHRSTQVRKDKGKEAEEWLREALKKQVVPHCWKISARPERDEDNLESDIVLKHDQKGTYHIEVKHAEANALYWSIKEVEKAHKNPKHYWMVIIRPTVESQTGYRSILIENPLETLKHNERRGTWLWQGREDNVQVNDGWDPPQPKPVKEANNFSFRISISDNCFNWNKFPNAFDFIKDKLIKT